MSVGNVDARLVGIIGKAHGIRGELNVRLLTDYPETIYGGVSLFLDRDCTKKITVENISFRNSGGKKIALVKFVKIDTRSQAESLIGSYLYRKPEDTPALEKGQYWVDDLEGCMVYNREGILVGEVIKVESYSSNSNLMVKRTGSVIEIPGAAGDIFFIPLISDYIKDIDTGRKKIILKKIPEFI